jgi:predicted metalloprotease with PDZ domain
MPLTITKRNIIHSLTAICLLLCFHLAAQAADNFRVDYTVKIASVDEQLFHVTTDVQNINQPSLDLSLPVWTPGWYTVENYAKNILRFKATDAKGNRLPLMMTRKQTWRVPTKGVKQVRVEFDYKATLLSLNQAKITKDWAVFTGTQLFLEAVGHRNSPSLVRFEAPEGWQIASSLKETAKPNEFTAPDYDTLVDSPTQLGKFDTARFEVEGKPHYFLTTPAGAVPKEKANQAADIFAKIVKAQSAIFGGLPYEKYLAFYFFLPPDNNGGGGLEHNNSHISIVGPQAANAPEQMAGLFSHELFHLWNVKRIRPAEMWPYDYSREQETPSLWVSEGLTNYYGILAEYRAGGLDRKQFLEIAGGNAGSIEANDARNYISPANSSVSTWLGYDSPVAFSISYYGQGQNLSSLLDISIRRDSAGAFGLDNMMRALYRDYYQKGRGFTAEDLLAIIKKLTKKDYRDFFNRYVWGVEVPPYSEIFGYAGIKAEKKVIRTPRFGFQNQPTEDKKTKIIDVLPGLPVAEAGLQVGDVVLEVDGMAVGGNWLDSAQRAKLAPKIGQTIEWKIRRGDKEMTVPVKIGFNEFTNYEITERPDATPEQLKIREAWLKK